MQHALLGSRRRRRGASNKICFRRKKVADLEHAEVEKSSPSFSACVPKIWNLWFGSIDDQIYVFEVVSKSLQSAAPQPHGHGAQELVSRTLCRSAVRSLSVRCSSYHGHHRRSSTIVFKLLSRLRLLFAPPPTSPPVRIQRSPWPTRRRGRGWRRRLRGGRPAQARSPSTIANGSRCWMRAARVSWAFANGCTTTERPRTSLRRPTTAPLPVHRLRMGHLSVCKWLFEVGAAADISKANR